MSELNWKLLYGYSFGHRNNLELGHVRFPDVLIQKYGFLRTPYKFSVRIDYPFGSEKQQQQLRSIWLW